MSSPSFSICIPNYNYGRYIGETIRSVLNQSYDNFEIVIADNCSTDNSIEVIRSFNSDKIRLIQNRWNIGFAPNIQKATEAARNDFLLVLPSDDMLHSNALEVYASVFSQLGSEARNSVAFADADIVDNSLNVQRRVGRTEGSFEIARLSLDGDGTVESEKKPFEQYRGMEVLREIIVRLTIPGPFQSFVFSRELYDAVDGFNTTHRVCPDAHFIQKILFLDPTVLYIREPLVACRHHDTTYVGRAAAAASVDLPIDHYLLLQEFTDEQLDQCGRKREELLRTYIDRFCIRPAFVRLAEGHRLWAFKHLALGCATYPRRMARDWRFWGIVPLLILGRLGSPAARLVYAAWKRRRSR